MKIDISDLLHVIGKAVQNCEQLLTVYYCPLINTKCYIFTFDTFKDTTIKICDNRRLVVTSSFVFYVITFEPIEVQTRSAPQNYRMNLSFVKHIKVVVKKMASNGQKTAIRAGGWRRLPINDDICNSFLKSLCPNDISIYCNAT